MALAVIPARGGSKRCPGKNMKDFRGKPLILWTIEAAKKAKGLEMIVVSTDDLGVADLASPHVPVVMRPTELGSDTATNEDVIRHVLTLFRQWEWVVLLQPTSPLRTAEDIDACLRIAKNGDGCVSYRESNGTKNGAVYVARSSWLAENDFSVPFRNFYVMPDERSLDIDHPEEFLL